MRAARVAFVIASAFFLFEFVCRVEPGLATKSISSYRHLSAGGFGTLSSLFFWVYAPMQIVVGVLLDRYGARRFVILGPLLCGLGVLLFTLGGNLAWAGIGRALTGFGAAFAFVAALWEVNHWFSPGRFAVLSGGVNAIGMLGTAMGGMLLAGLIEHHGWQPVFIGTAATGLLIALAAVLWLREPSFPAENDSRSAIAHVRGNLVAVATSGRVWIIAVIGMLFYMPVNVYGGLWGTSELITDHHLSGIAAQTAIAMIFCGVAAGSIAGGWLSDRLGHRKFLVFGGALMCALAYATAIYTRPSALIEASLLFAAGLFGGLQMLVFAMAKESMANAMAGTVLAFVNMLGIAGALIFQPLLGFLVDLSGGHFALAMTTVPGTVALAALIVLALPEYRHPDHLPESQPSGLRDQPEAG